MSGQRTQWNEATRVQMPALVHLTRIGFTYFGKITEDKAGTVYDPDTNILIEVFKSQFAKLNPERAGEAEAMLRIIRQELDNDDIGESFYKRLKAVSPVRLIDFEHPENNTFHCSAEFTCKRDEDEFRPDITLFVNGLPLVFIEVKKPNNIGGMVAEAERMNKLRFPNKKFRRFINITQLMIFSNNMEYDAMGGIVPIQGVFYCTGSKKGSPFNCFREENPLNLDVAPYNRDFPYKDIDPEVEKQILSDFNNQVIHTSPEYQTNLRTTTPTNRVLTSMCSPDRLLFLLKYGITYYHKTKELDDGTIEQIDQKHIMRYQQFFAAMIVRERISEGTTSGIIWHTQGSGKTALSFHLSYVLTDYFASINKVTKFYFIVDRLDLMKQSKEEFTARGLVVKTASSRAELMEQFRTNQSQEGTTGEPEITVVNIQRFEERQDKVVLPSYATNLQRVFIIDEAHRGYKPEGSFLANLFDADPNSIKIALTGTPLLKSERESWRVFGNYLHTYYYDKSVQDGYASTIRTMLDQIGKQVLEITTDDLRAYLTDYQVEKKSSKVTIDNIRRILSSFFTWLEDEDYILKSPIRRIHKVKSAATIKETYTDESLEKMRDNCDGLRDLAIIDMLSSTGMRVGEMVRLNRDDIRFDERECVVFGKGDKERIVYFDARTKIHLQNYLQSRTDSDPALFVSLQSPHRRLTIGGIELRLRELGKRLDIPKVHPHKFRRTLATMAIDKGMPIEQLQHLLGHQRIDTTMHYAMVKQSNVKLAHKKYIG